MRFYVFVPVVIAIYALVSWLGWPHPIWAYEYHAVDMHPLSKRHYLSCTFVGPTYGRWTEPAEDGRCAWVRWRRAE